MARDMVSPKMWLKANKGLSLETSIKNEYDTLFGFSESHYVVINGNKLKKVKNCSHISLIVVKHTFGARKFIQLSSIYLLYETVPCA